MNASEKLKELHPLLTGPPARKFRDGTWDEIITVVEAAEKLCGPDIGWGPHPELRAALTALNKALQ
jgi:hypothetical protein